MKVREGEIYLNPKSRILAITSVSSKWIYVRFNDNSEPYRYSRKIWEKSNIRLLTDKYFTWKDAVSSPEFRGEK